MTSAERLLESLLQESGSSYASYSSQIYTTKHQTSRSPEITADLGDLERSAKARLSPHAYNYAASGCGLESTVQANRDAFHKVRSKSAFAELRR